jgi:CBS domain-containing protein
MKLKEIMTSDVEIVSPETILQTAAQKMRDLDVGSLPVCDGRRLVGMLTDRDITVRATAEGRHPGQTRVEEAMTQDLVFCYEDQDEQDAALAMEQYQIRRLPILNRNKHLVGILSLGDLAVDTTDRNLAGEALEEISKPAQPAR